jgi:EAL domain-containing protein (putative c-di-GMP-specific phosphodiesterase class I)/GGDEF domain-containing protein
MNKRSHIDREAPRDPVTGLPPIDTVRGRIAEWLAQEAAGGEPARVHLLLLGLHRLDAVNLAYGASVGDSALAEVAGRISRFADQELDGAWLVARGSGGNFLLAANETCSRDRWHLFAEHLADRIARPIPAVTGSLQLSPKLALLRGLAEEGVESMLDRLGQTLSGNRWMQGRRIAWVDGEAVPPGRTAAQLEADLLGAIDRDEIEIVFQPQFALPDDRLSGAEALARWRHPTLGRIGAAALFTVAERVDHLAPLSRHIARRALAAAARWPDRLRLSLNVTPADLAAGSYAGELMTILHESGFPADRLTLEVIEQALLGDLQLAGETLRLLKAEGIRIALDDFGAGFCNFRYLKLLPLDYLKLDRSMVEGITSDPRDLAVLRAIVAMAGALDLRVIAEGVESEDQRAKIAEEGCAFYQGFLRAQPMTAVEFAVLASS